MAASPDQIAIFLSEFTVKLKMCGILFRSDRGKNTQTLLDLELTVNHVKEILGQLLVEDYSGGPTEEKLYGNAAMWIFGKWVKNTEIYIKISMGRPSDKTICISFHKAEHAMRYPYKKRPS